MVLHDVARCKKRIHLSRFEGTGDSPGCLAVQARYRLKLLEGMGHSP